jgi:hypothetical protein
MLLKSTALTYRTTKGRELVRLEHGAAAAEVVIGRAGEEELRALAAACIEAADEIANRGHGQQQAA